LALNRLWGEVKLEIPRDLIESLRAASHIAALTGAGISKESGIPTFREAQTGLWARYEPTELATPEAFLENPALVWNWYTWRRGLIQQTEPNPGHFALARLESLVPKFTLITQNVDGFHKNAGSKNLLELHGNIFRTKCFSEGTIIDQWDESAGNRPPLCPTCGDYLRPDVVWFGEGLPQNTLEAGIRASQTAEVFFSIGTSAVVHPAASLPVYALESGAVLIEINPAPTHLTPYAAYVLNGPSGEILPALVEATWPGTG
jgi:NAD-dependent deacetylase